MNVQIHCCSEKIQSYYSQVQMADEPSVKISGSLINIDFAGLGKFGEKLLNTAERGVTSLLAPIQIRREALARADEKRIMGEADADVIVSQERGEVRRRELRERALRRIASQEEYRQENLESVLFEAAKHPREDVSVEPVSGDWISTFVESAQDFSDREMQALWGKLLAGEVSKPGAVSKRLLNAVRLMSTDDARNFTQLCREVFSFNPNFPKGQMSPIFFMNSGRTLGWGLEIEPFELLGFIPYEGALQGFGHKRRRESEFYGRKVIFCGEAPENEGTRRYNPYVKRFTRPGRELLKIVSPDSPQPLPPNLVESFRRANIDLLFEAS